MTDKEYRDAYDAGFTNGTKAMAQQVEGILEEDKWCHSLAVEDLEKMLREFWGDE